MSSSESMERYFALPVTDRRGQSSDDQAIEAAPSRFVNQLIARAREAAPDRGSELAARLSRGALALSSTLGGFCLNDDELFVYGDSSHGMAFAGSWHREAGGWTLRSHGYDSSPAQAQEKMQSVPAMPEQARSHELHPAFCLAVCFAALEKQFQKTPAREHWPAGSPVYTDVLDPKLLQGDQESRQKVEEQITALNHHDLLAVPHKNGGLEYFLKYGRNRILSFRERGDPKGYPIIFFSGTLAGGGVMLPSNQELHEAGYRLVEIDRPGYGRSDPDPNRPVAYTAMHAHRVAELLKIKDYYALAGRSAGGPFALAAALAPRREQAGRLLPAHGIDKTLIMVSPTPPGAELVYYDDLGKANTEAASLELDAFTEWSLGIKRDPWSHWRRLAPDFSEADTRLFQDPELAVRMAASQFRSVEYHAYGWRDQVAAFAADWEYAVKANRYEGSFIRFWGAAKDPFTPQNRAEWFNRNFGKQNLYIDQEASHLTATVDFMTLIERYFGPRRAIRERHLGRAATKSM